MCVTCWLARWRLAIGGIPLLVVCLLPSAASAGPFHLEGPWISREMAGALDLEWHPDPDSTRSAPPRESEVPEDWPAPSSMGERDLERRRREVKVRRILARIFHSSGWPLAAVGTAILGPTTVVPSPQTALLTSVMVSGGITLIVNAFANDVRADKVERYYFPDDWEQTRAGREAKRPGKGRAEPEPEPEPDGVRDGQPGGEPEPEPEPEPEKEEPNPDTPPWDR